jgi:AcrR family transcriptional regulator
MPRTEEANQQIRRNQREKILSAARNVFARKGRNTTMADIAVEAGISQGLAYRYFSSKEAILTASVKQAAQSDGGPTERIKQIKAHPAHAWHF